MQLNRFVRIWVTEQMHLVYPISEEAGFFPLPVFCSLFPKCRLCEGWRPTSDTWLFSAGQFCMLPFKSFLGLKFGIQSYSNMIYFVINLFSQYAETQNATWIYAKATWVSEAL